MNRDMLRAEAKRIYKEQTKNIPRRNRIPFSQFFKQFKKLKSKHKVDESAPPTVEEEDFNFEDLINMNDISDDDLVEEENDSE